LSTFSANRCFRGIFGNVAAAGRAFYKATLGTYSLVRSATQCAAFYLAALDAKRNTVGSFRCAHAASFFGLFAAIAVQK
jgi:hypothetical protein